MSFRMTRFEWLASKFPYVMPRTRTASNKREAATKPKIRWLFLVPEQGSHTILAYTRGEARSLMKATLKVTRLPSGTEIRRLP